MQKKFTNNPKKNPIMKTIIILEKKFDTDNRFKWNKNKQINYNNQRRGVNGKYFNK